MPSISLLFACLVALYGLASATPLNSRQSATCKPNFEGAGVSVITGDVEWGVVTAAVGQPILHSGFGGDSPPNATANWYVPPSGSASATYVFKYVFGPQTVYQ